KINNIVNSKTETLTVYPNPATSTTTIKGENIKQILVFDVYGKQVLLQQNTGKSNTITLNTANLRSGMYIVKAYSNNGTFTSTKFVKQ
nr:T9SS type A sorting domain-containing protein [Chitinophagaceae bacterium]